MCNFISSTYLQFLRFFFFSLFIKNVRIHEKYSRICLTNTRFIFSLGATNSLFVAGEKNLEENVFTKVENCSITVFPKSYLRYIVYQSRSRHFGGPR